MGKINFRAIVNETIANKDISIARIARLTDLNHCTVYNFLNGRSEMTSGNLERLLNTLATLPNRKKKKGEDE